MEREPITKSNDHEVFKLLSDNEVEQLYLDTTSNIRHLQELQASVTSELFSRGIYSIEADKEL